MRFTPPYRSVFALILLVSLFVFAAPVSAALYAPGETLDPACAPTDPNCGIVPSVASSSANSIPYYAANGSILSATSTITILPNGNVGIGSTTPSSKLSVGGDINFTGNIYNNGNLLSFGLGTTSIRSLFSSTAPGLTYASSTGIFSLTSGYTIPLTASTTDWQTAFTNRITSVSNDANITGTLSNNVLTLAWNGLLSVARGGTGTSTAPTLGQILLGNGSGGYNLVATSTLGLQSQLTGTAGQVLYFSGTNTPAATSTLFIASNGNIGIGSTTPSALFTVDSSSTTGTVFRLNNTSTGGRIYSILSTGSANTSGAGRFDIFDNASSTSRFSIASNGNVGIGTTTPGSLFTVAGNSYFSGSLNVGDASTTRSNLNLQYATTTNLVFDSGIAAWGDSITFGYGANANQSYPSIISGLFGGTRNVYNGGVSGETSVQIRNRMLAASDKSGYTTIIFAGYNDIANLNSTTTIESNIAAMVASLGSNNRYVVLSILNGSGEPSGSSKYNAIVQTNANLAAQYPGHYLDIRSYLVSQYNSSLSQDVTDHTNDVVPNSLRFDSIHPNAAGYALIGQQVYNFITTNLESPLNLPSSSSIITNLNAAALFAAPPAIGGTTPNSAVFTSVSGGIFKINGIATLYATSTNLSVGLYALPFINRAINNTAIGYQSLSVNTTGSQNTSVGSSLISNTTGSDNTAIGYGALYLNVTGSQNTATGLRALYANVSGTGNTANGYQALQNNTSGGSNTAVGAGALFANISGGNNIAIGLNALSISTTTSFNIAVGGLVLSHITSGTPNEGFGYGALDFTTTGSANTALGYQSLLQNTTGSSNVAVGNTSLTNNVTGSSNTAIGVGALANATSTASSVAIGYNAGATTGNTTGKVLVGYRAGYSGTTGSDYSTLIGYQSGYGITTGARNILIGVSTIAASFGQITTGSRNISIGDDIAVASSTASNQLNIGNLIFGTGLSGTGTTIAGKIGIGTSSPATLLEVGGATNNVTLDGYLNCTGFTSTSAGLLTCTASDQRLKQDVTTLSASSTLDALSQLNAVSFHWKSQTGRGDTLQYGLLAQQVQGVFPNLVTKTNPTALTPDGTYTVNYEGLIAPLIVGVQELMRQVASLSEAITTKKLCLEDVCITKTQLQKILDESNQQSVIVVPPPGNSGASGEEPADEASSTPSEEVTIPEVQDPAPVESEDPITNTPASTDSGE